MHIRVRAIRRLIGCHALLHPLDRAIEDGEQDFFFGLEIISQLPAAHAGLGFDCGQRQVLNAAGRDDIGRGIDDLLAADGGDVDAGRRGPTADGRSPSG